MQKQLEDREVKLDQMRTIAKQRISPKTVILARGAMNQVLKLLTIDLTFLAAKRQLY